jgi:hypothetical protein
MGWHDMAIDLRAEESKDVVSMEEAQQHARARDCRVNENLGVFSNRVVNDFRTPNPRYARYKLNVGRGSLIALM